jgi:hypothetical protein
MLASTHKEHWLYSAEGFRDVGVVCCMAFLTDWRILLAFLVLVLAIAIMLYRSERG